MNIRPCILAFVKLLKHANHIISHAMSKHYIILQTYCSLAIYKCASDPITRNMIRDAGGLELLVEAAQDSTNRSNKPLMAAVTGALWKCADSDPSVKRLDTLGAVPILVRLLDDENDGVLTNVAGALAECAKYPPNRDKIRAAGGIPMLSRLPIIYSDRIVLGTYITYIYIVPMLKNAN